MAKNRNSAPAKRSSKPAQRRAPAPASAQEFDNELRGVLFKNNRKTTDRHPDYTGQCMIDGVEFWISAWMNKSKQGKPFMALSFAEKEEQQDEQEYEPETSADDDLPF